jgi:branched-chain amino acid transport system substrate-binding protein
MGRQVGSLFSAFILLSLLCAPWVQAANPTIKIGFNLELTGDIPKVGESSKNSAEMIRQQVNAAGGLKVGEKHYDLEFVYEDNESKAESAVPATLKMIERDKVLAMIGPNSSKAAVPAGQIANDHSMPMVTPWSTNPATTENRPYVFRAAFLDSFQGPVAVNFAKKKYHAKTAAVLYTVSNDYSFGLAKFFKDEFEKANGVGSVVAYESYNDKDQDFSAQLTKIIAKKPAVLFLPDLYTEVALIVKQAKELGWKGPILGSDSWGGSSDLFKLCGKDCVGYYFSTHYTAVAAQGKTKEFIDSYKKQYGSIPDDVAALTWDAVHLVLQSIQKAGKLTGKIEDDRKNLRQALASIKNFSGVTGKMSFEKNGDPIKCAVIVQVNPQGEFAFSESVCP